MLAQTTAPETITMQTYNIRHGAGMDNAMDHKGPELIIMSNQYICTIIYCCI
jgi:hypothetical protein